MDLGREALSCDLPPCKQPLRDDIPTILNALNKCGKDRTGTDLLLLQNLCRHLEVFKSLKESAVTELCRVVTLTTIGAGQAVFCAGDIGTAYFAILKGRVAVLIPQNEKEALQAAKKKLTPKVARDMLMIPSTPKGKKDSQRKVSMRRGSMGELPATVPLVSLRVRKLGATDNEQTIKAYEDLVSEDSHGHGKKTGKDLLTMPISKLQLELQRLNGEYRRVRVQIDELTSLRTLVRSYGAEGSDKSADEYSRVQARVVELRASLVSRSLVEAQTSHGDSELIGIELTVQTEELHRIRERRKDVNTSINWQHLELLWLVENQRVSVRP